MAFLMIAAVFAGCAKRPATTQASAPAPTGAAGAMGSSAAGTTGSGGTAAGGGSQAGMQPGSTGGGTGGTAAGPGPAGTPPAAAAPGSTGPGTSAAQPGAPTTTPGARPAPSQFAAVPQLRDIFFDFDKYDIRPNDAKVLDENAAWLKSNPEHLVLIEGHCDERGTNEYNLALGERRAKSTMNYLVSQGVQAGRITIISYGEERPTCSEHNEACWSKNRRAHFLVKQR